MKKVELLAGLLALALGASAQNHRPVSPNAIRPNAIGPNAHRASANAEGVTTIHPAAAAQSADAAAKPSSSDDPPGPTARKVRPNAVVGPTAKK